ncbi:acyl-CoA thioesterase [Actinomycetospora straminea]|uniref:Thioesterase family protein n=1 Tax=Actinomycetospora straminea TaxID=663607 RepID=A0ABP9EJZ1_9PSEU|nr:thioesterase family protein [Actinomycetospora straminea]MDD7933296.1 thioesterase family protein [Actinomycetospora straminea]
MADDYGHWQDVTTRWNDNDQYGHLNNVVHHAIMDTVVNRWLIENDCLDPHGGDTAGLVMEVRCEYKAQAGFPDVVSVGLRVGELGTSSVRFEVGMYRGDGELFFTGDFVHAFVDRETEKTVPIEGHRRAALEGLQRTA